jgi:anaerobic magnesium-protoporphyrin IX monomethyl ester cyclase
MMFHGTYTSDFYRAIRNLLHEQISPRISGAADGSLDQRWQNLLANELQYRSSPDRSAATA